MTPIAHRIQKKPASYGMLLFLLVVISSATNMDRAITVLVLEPLRIEFGLSDLWIGLISGGPFAVVYSLVSIPLAIASDRGNQRRILTLCFIVWIITMALCGCATSAVALLLARMGVGVGEAGVVPPSHAIIGRSVPIERQGSAFSIYSLSTILGAPIAYTLGGWIIAEHGWRALYLTAAAISVPAAVAGLVLLPHWQSPNAQALPIPRERGATADSGEPDNFVSLAWITVACSAYSLYTYGPLNFLGSYMLRYTGIGIASLGWALGILMTIASIVGAVGGTTLANVLVLRSRRWLVNLPAVGFLISIPLTILTFGTNSAVVSLAGMSVISALLFATYPSIYATVQFLAPSKKRTLTIAVVLSVSNLVGMLIGPLVTGFLSDLLLPHVHHENLRLSIILVSFILLPGAIILYATSRRLSERFLSTCLGPASGRSDLQ